MALVLVVVTMFVSVGVISTMTRLRPVAVVFVRFVSIVVTIMMIVMIIIFLIGVIIGGLATNMHWKDRRLERIETEFTLAIPVYHPPLFAKCCHCMCKCVFIVDTSIRMSNAQESRDGRHPGSPMPEVP